MLLTQIANEEGTDKGTRGPVEGWQGNNYTDVYDAYLQPLRDKPITFLEIGLGVAGPNVPVAIAQGRNAQGGASIRMWYRYLEKARILGIDVNPAGFLDNDRVLTGVVDQGDPDQLRNFPDKAGVEQLDVVIDDGSHLPHHQQISLSTLFPYVAKGGVYFIEDLLENGKGDVRIGPGASSATVVNTRRLVREYLETGSFPGPNALTDIDAWAGDIEAISFYCPSVNLDNPSQLKAADRVKIAASMLLGRRLGMRRRFTQFATGREELCAIRKRG